MSGVLLGCIADDFTGATDLANNLVRGGMRVLQANGVPEGPLATHADAVVVALKSRTIPPAEAVDVSLKALRWLRDQGARQIYFKYCSTFDSTPVGNIGPVAEALMQALGAPFTIATPAFPDNQRTVFQGHLFVGTQLLSDSGMKDHPLTPMRDANLVRVLQAQCRGPVGLIDYRTVAAGPQAIRERVQQLQSEGVAIAIADAIGNDDLLRLGAAVKDLALLTAGSGLAIGLPQNFGVTPSGGAASLPPPRRGRAIVSGSCSAMTRAQVRHFVEGGGSAYAVDPLRLASGEDVVAEALAWAGPRLAQGPVLVYSTADPQAVQSVQGRVGAQSAGELVERCLAAIARGLVQAGAGQLVVAGGETSGACVQALGIAQMQIGPQIDPGVPWCHAPSAAEGRGLHLALKSGNFGAEDFFTRAWTLLP